MAKKHKQKKHGEEENGEAWLLPYSDLMTLLLAVFIVLFAVSKVDETKAEKIAEAFREGMMSGSEGILSGVGDSFVPHHSEGAEEETPQKQGTENSETDTTQQANVSQDELEEFLGTTELGNLEELKSKLEVMFKNEDLTTDITTSIDKRGLIISLNNAILFESGSAEIKPQNEFTLIKIAKIINTLNNYIRIEGHTDNLPIHSAVYPSNWELSTARAASVVRLFINECNVSPEKVVAVGYGEYKPITDNSTKEKRAKNRRIDIIVLSEKYNNLERQITK
ncbi:OmpA family protein [Anaerocolumna sedimenticola]|uniref:OmpA family protein n=1 Tax=Anaerocolumna sedimenticola TaxID=2696063 RepID=A0A6P1TQR4_9FIRM|nr:flagellar motor protein MotB [Anaerocolumna sedimenticola]QHQ62106.1 OmpA family protein [Anaerocolumna sedimenticola]